MLIGSRAHQERTTLRAGWVWSVVDDRQHAARVEYAAGACGVQTDTCNGTMGTKRNQPIPRRALDA